MTKRKTAIITGATSGIGTKFAQTLAKDGWDLIISGRREDRLTQLKEELSLAYQVSVHGIRADLAVEEELNSFLSTTDNYTNIELLINNAGFGSIGNYFKSDYTHQQHMLNVHITATTKLIYHLVPGMIKNGKGAIINVASLSAFFPGPNSYFYCSSKAFLVTFSECLHIDLASKNIKTQVLCPGFTNTEFHSRQGITCSDSYIKQKLLWTSAQHVVDKSLRSLGNRRVICIPGLFNRLIYYMVKVLPKPIYYRLAEKNSDSFLKPADNKPNTKVKARETQTA